MHRTIRSVSTRFIRVRPGEGRKVALTFLYFFLIMAGYYVIKPVSRSLVLGELGSRMVPYVDLVCAVLMGPLVALFARLVDRVPKPRLVGWSFAAIIGCLAGFWWLIPSGAAWAAGMFYVWVAVFSVLVVTLFWLVANDLYRARDAKRLFGLIGSGGILGGIIGSSCAAVGAQLIGTRHLLLLSCGLLLGGGAVVRQLWGYVPARVREDEARRLIRRDTYLSNPRGFARLLLGSRYLLLLVAIVGLGKLVATLVSYQLNPFIEQAFPDPDARTTFTGMFLGAVNVAAFIVQFFFTSWILRRWGLLTALLVLPVTLLAGTTGLLCLPIFALAAVTELCDASLNYSLQQSAKEVLYLPIDRSVRYKVKPFIDMVVFRFGKGLAAVFGIILLNWLHLPALVLGYVIIPLLVIWLMVAWAIRSDYLSTIRTTLQARAMAKRAPAAAVDAGSPAAKDAGMESFGPLLHPSSATSTQKLALLDRLVAGRNVPGEFAERLFRALTDYEMDVAKTSEMEHEPFGLQSMVIDRMVPMARRRQAIRLLLRCADQVTVDYLVAVMMLEADAGLRHEAARGLVKLRVRGLPLKFPRALIYRHVAREVASYQRIRSIIAICRRYQPELQAGEDPACTLLLLLLHESVEQIFRLLMLLHRPEDIHLVYEQLQAPDDYLRTDAIELLDNLVDAPMRAILLPILDEDRFLSVEAPGGVIVQEPTAAYRIMREAIWDHHSWLSVTTLCAIGRMHLTTMRQELERASSHHMPVVATAAKIALHLAGQG